MVKKVPASVGDLGSIPRSGRSPGEGNGSPLQYSWPGEFHEQTNLVGYSPWGHKESDMTERLTHMLVVAEPLIQSNVPGVKPESRTTWRRDLEGNSSSSILWGGSLPRRVWPSS